MRTSSLHHETLPSGATLVSRRDLIQVAGVTLVGTAFLGLTGCASMPGMATLAALPRADVGPISARAVAGVPVGFLDGGTKHIAVAPPGSMDPVAHSVADTLFWGEQLMEHAMFFAMLMPGPELAGLRGEAEPVPAAVRRPSRALALKPDHARQLRRLQQQHDRARQ